MVVQTRAQKKLADAAAQAAFATPARRDNNRKRAAVAAQARARTRAQHLGDIQTPAGNRAFQRNSNSKNIASSSRVKTPVRPTRTRFAAPVFIPDRDSESGSSSNYSQPTSSYTPSQEEQQSGTDSSSSSSFASLSSLFQNTNSAGSAEPTINSEIETGGGGWVRFGSDMRRETLVPAEILAQFQAQQQASLAKRAEDAYNEHTKEMMRQHDLTYQWYDRMMTEGLQNENKTNATGGGASTVETALEDDAMTDVGSDDSEEGRDSNMEDGEAHRNSNMEDDERSVTRTETDMEDDKEVVPYRQLSPRRVINPNRKQYQPCPPGVRYSLHSTPTLILPPWNSDDL